METAIEKRKGANGAVAIPDELKGPWGTASDVDTSDVLIPKLLLMQGLSKLVAEGDAAQGEIIRSTSGKALAKKGETVEFIPLLTYKTWVLEEKVGSKYEYRRVEPMTAANKDLPLEFVDGANQWRRNRCLNFYVLLPQDISKEAAALKAAAAGDLPDPEDALLPCVLSFRRTSYNAGKILATHFKKAEHFKVAPAVTVFKLSSTVEKNELGTFHAFTVEPGRKATVEELTVAKRWFDTLQRVSVKVDEPEVDEAPVAEASEQDATF